MYLYDVWDWLVIYLNSIKLNKPFRLCFSFLRKKKKKCLENSIRLLSKLFGKQKEEKHIDNLTENMSQTTQAYGIHNTRINKLEKCIIHLRNNFCIIFMMLISVKLTSMILWGILQCLFVENKQIEFEMDS